MPIFFATVIADKIFGVHFVFAQFERDVRGFEEARAVGLHSVGLPGSNEATRPALQASTQSAMGAASSRWCVVITMVRLLWRKPRQQLNHLARALHVHVGERLVEQQQFRHRKQNAGQRGALAHALRILAERARQIRIEAHLAQRIGGIEARRGRDKGWRSSADFPARSARRKAWARGSCSRCARAHRSGSYSPNTLTLPCGWPQQPGQNAQQRGLAGAIFADQHVAASRLKIDRNLAQRCKDAKEFGNVIEPGARGTADGLSESCVSCVSVRGGLAGGCLVGRWRGLPTARRRA